MPDQLINEQFDPSKPIAIGDFAKALRSDMQSAGIDSSSFNDKQVIRKFLDGPGAKDSKWAPLIKDDKLTFYEGTPPTPGPPARSATKPAAKPETQAADPKESSAADSGGGLGERLDSFLKEKAEGPPSVGGTAAAFVRMGYTPISESLGMGTMRGFEHQRQQKIRSDAQKVPGLIAKGNIDLNNRPIVKNSDGTTSTVRTMTIEEEGKTILIPTVVGGNIVSKKKAIDHYHKTHEHMGIFDSEYHADQYDRSLHNQMGWQGAPGSAQAKWQAGAAGTKPLSNTERFAGQTMEEIAGLGDSILSPVGLLTVGAGPAIRAASKAKGAAWVMRKLGVAEKLARWGFAGTQAVGAMDAFGKFIEDPTPENAAKAVSGGALATISTAPEIIEGVKMASRLPGAVKAGAKGFGRGYRGEVPEEVEPEPAPKKTAAPPSAEAEPEIGPPKPKKTVRKGPEPEAAPEGKVPKPKKPAPVAGGAEEAPEQETTEVPETTPEPVYMGPKLPSDLAGARPHYAAGKKQLSLKFASDVDRAAYITATTNKSIRDADYLKFVSDAKGGLSEGEVRALGRRVKEKIKILSQRAKSGDSMDVPSVIELEKTPKPPSREAKASAEPKKPSEKSAAKPAEKATPEGLSQPAQDMAALLGRKNPPPTTKEIRAAWDKLSPEQQAEMRAHTEALKAKKAAAETKKEPAKAAPAKAEPREAPVRPPLAKAEPAKPSASAKKTEAPAAESKIPPVGTVLVDTYGDEYVYKGKTKEGLHKFTDPQGQVQTEELSDEDFSKQFTTKGNTKTAAPPTREAAKAEPEPAKPAAAEPTREDVAKVASKDIATTLGNLKQSGTGEQFPIKVKLVDKEGNTVGEVDIKDADDLKASRSTLEEALGDPKAETVLYEGPGGKGMKKIAPFAADLRARAQGREPGDPYRPGVTSQKKTEPTVAEKDPGEDRAAKVEAAKKRLQAARQRGQRGSISHDPRNPNDYPLNQMFQDIYSVGQDVWRMVTPLTQMKEEQSWEIWMYWLKILAERWR